MHKKLTEIALLLLSFSVVALILMLASYNTADPGPAFSSTGFSRSGEVSNLGGHFGAILSDGAYYLFGWGAFLLVFLPAKLCLPLWRHYQHLRRGATPGLDGLVQESLLSLLSWLALLLTTATFCTALQLPTGELPNGAGGVLGAAVDARLNYFGNLKTAIALLGFVIATIIATNLSVVVTLSRLQRLLLLLLRLALKMLWAIPRGLFGLILRLVRGAPAADSTPARSGAQARAVPATTTPAEAATNTAQPSPLPAPVTPPEPAAAESRQGSVFQRPTTGGSNLPKFPYTSLLTAAGGERVTVPEQVLTERARSLEGALKNHGIQAEVMEVLPGPVVTRFELQPQPGLKVSKVSNAATDLARELSVGSLRAIEIIEGKTYFGIEVPNENRQTVLLSQTVGTEAFRSFQGALPIALGVDITGTPVIADLAAMPHLIVAGATGSGKSVCIHSILVSLLLRNSPDQLRLVLIDPKMIELGAYDPLPHLMAPVVTDSHRAMAALNWCVEEMDRRYELLAEAGTRDLNAYNEKARSSGGDAEPMPRLVVVLDELADLMMVSGKAVEQQIARIAQKARAAGMHLLLATQRPSVDVITGLIKANVPARIAFYVASDSNSRIILDQSGAQQLLGKGDMLFLPPGRSQPMRVHGAFTSDAEARKVVDYWRGRKLSVERLEAFPTAAGASGGSAASAGGGNAGSPEDRELYAQARDYVLQSGKTSVSSIQRHLRIGFNRASRLVEDMEAQGLLSAPDARGVRQIREEP